MPRPRDVPQFPPVVRALGLAVAGIAASPAVGQAPWTNEEMAADLEQIAAAVRGEWSYFDDRREHSGVDVDALLAAAKAELSEVRSARDFARVLRRFGAGLQDGHAGTFVPTGPLAAAKRLPFSLADCPEGVTVVAVAAGAAAPARGDVLLAIDGSSCEAALAAAAREVFASTPGMRRRLALSELPRTNAETVRCTFRKPDGTRVELTVTAGDGAEPVRARPEAENWSLRWPRDRVAVLRASSFQVPRWREWMAARPEEREPFLAEGRSRIDAIVAELLERRAEALIVDLRGNGGGTDLLGIHFAERLLAGPFVYFRLSAKQDDRWTAPGGMTYGKDSHARFAGKVIALIDELTFSAADNFARCLSDEHPDFVAIGRPSGGGSGAPRQLVEARHTKATLIACTQRVYGPRGQLVEGRGTVPDVAVRWTRADWLGDRDPDLDAAFAALAEKR